MARESYAIQPSFRTGVTVNATNTHHVCDTVDDLPGADDSANGDTAILLDTGAQYVRINGAWKHSSFIENRTDDPASPAVGRMWLRTDL